MTQNRSHAVMAQRHEPNDALDDFPTPPWATRALCEHVIELRGRTVWEPACNRGYMVKALKEYALKVHASDVHDYGYGFGVRDFLWPGDDPVCDWVITNPPFRLAEQFILNGLGIAKEGVAVLVRTVFIEGVGRYNALFNKFPPAILAQFAERAPMVRGRVDEDANSATAYCWLVWRRKHGGTPRLQWIKPCRSKLERHGDYE